MVNLDLGLVFQQGHGRPVPVWMDWQIIAYITGLRKTAVARDPTLIDKQRNDHSDVFYDSRTHLNQHGWDTSVYNDNVAGGGERRKKFYVKIKGICENYHGVKRHQIGIFPDDRAVMAYQGNYYSVGFESLQRLMVRGTDIIVVEKAGTVLKMVPFTRNRGIAFIQSQGFVSEYGIALAQLANVDYQTAKDFTNGYVPKYSGHVGALADCDSSGMMIGLKIPGATRLGIDLNTIKEMIDVNRGLNLTDELSLTNLVESTTKNTHWDGLSGVLSMNRRSKPYQALFKLGLGLALPTHEKYAELLLQKVLDANGERLLFIDWLKSNRIELNTVLSIIKPEPFWNWLKWKLDKVWPDRNYNRVLSQPEPSDVYPPGMTNFITRLDNTLKPLIKEKYAPIEERLNKIRHFIKDTDGTQELINSRIGKRILAENEKIKLLTNRLEALADELGLARLSNE